MTRLLTSALLAAGFVLSADAPSLTGTWNVHRSGAGRESHAQCTFTQSGSQLAGTCAEGAAKVELTGAAKNGNISWTVKTDSEGGPVTLVYSGKFESDSKVVGKVNAVEFGIDGDFTATRAQ